MPRLAPVSRSPTAVGARGRAALAGAAAATVWGMLEPVDQRLFRCHYSDIALLGKAFTRGPLWRPVGFAVHALNGAIFGLAYHEVHTRTHVDARRLALALALLEHVALYPLAFLVDRYHPARGQSGVPPLLHSRRAFAQAATRHAVFGYLLGRWASAGERSRDRRLSALGD